jgi:hypothetical protein
VNTSIGAILLVPRFSYNGTHFAYLKVRPAWQVSRRSKMRNLDSTKSNNAVPEERFSRRIVNGVEIVERETIQKITVKGDRFETSRIRTPRLIVSDALEATRGFVSKARSEVVGLEKFLRGVNSPVEISR